MIKCGTGCNPLVYKGYGCYCGFLGSGDTVDGIDRYRDSSWPPRGCCWCWGAARCTTGATPPPPAWSCSTTCPTSSPTSGSVMEELPTVLLARPSPQVVEAVATRWWHNVKHVILVSTTHLMQLCECDRQFVQCLADYPCPNTKAMCMSPWRYFQNLFMGLGTGMVSMAFSFWNKEISL